MNLHWFTLPFSFQAAEHAADSGGTRGEEYFEKWVFSSIASNDPREGFEINTIRHLWKLNLKKN